MRKLAPAPVSYRDDFLISYRVLNTSRLGHFISRHLKVHFMLIKYTCDSKSLAPPVPVYQQTDFTPKRVVVSRLHDSVAR